MLAKLKFKTLFWSSNGFVSALMVVVAIVIYFNLRALIATAEWVTFSHRVIEQGYTLQKLLVDMETGERGFLITGMDEFLEPYYAGHKQFQETVIESQKMNSHNVELVDLLGQVGNLAQRWNKEVAEVAINLRKKVSETTKDADYFQAVLAEDMGKQSREIIETLEKLHVETSANKDVEILILSVKYDLRQQQVAERGFLITGKEGFLEEYRQGQENLNIHLGELESLLAKENKENLPIVSTIKTRVDKWTKETLTPRIKARQEMNENKTSLKDVAAFEATGKGKELIDQIRLLLTQFIDTEKTLLAERSQNTAYTQKMTIDVIIYGTAIALFIGLMMILLLTHKIMQVIHKVVDSATEVNGASEEISKGNLNLSQRTEEQASSLEETSSSMQQITTTMEQNADNAKRAALLANEAREKAQQGGKVVNTAIAAMREINSSSKKIADIISVIDEIAFQTNLLALNAAVEAARAGEQGRGFAVVATEVRNLSQRSASAAKETKTLIQDSVSKVEEGMRLVNQSGKALEDIVLANGKVNDIVSEISAASQEQAAGIQQINKAVLQLDEITQQNGALVEEAAAASQSLQEQAENLKEHVTFFGTSKIEFSAQKTTRSSASTSITIHDIATRRKRRATMAHNSASSSIAPVTPEEGWKDF